MKQDIVRFENNHVSPYLSQICLSICRPMLLARRGMKCNRIFMLPQFSFVYLRVVFETQCLIYPPRNSHRHILYSTTVGTLHKNMLFHYFPSGTDNAPLPSIREYQIPLLRKVCTISYNDAVYKKIKKEKRNRSCGKSKNDKLYTKQCTKVLKFLVVMYRRDQ